MDLVQNRPIGKLRPDDPEYFVTRYQYNEDHLLVWVKYPNRDYTVSVYQGDLEPNTPPRSRGNLREIHHFAGPLAPVSDQDKIAALFLYDTDSGDPCGFNVLVHSFDPRGNEKLYDYDDRGNRTRTIYKNPGPKPDIIVDYEYDTYGQLMASVQPDNGSGYRRRDEYKYYTDPNNPNYGYLKNVIIDSNNLALTTKYEYDRVGNVIRVIDSKGNDMQLIRNQLNQVVRRISAEVSSGIRYETDIYYDIKDNIIRVDVQNKDETGALGANTHFTTTCDYGILNNLTRVIREVDSNDSIVTEFEYDDNFRRTLTRLGEATNSNQPTNTIRTFYDERGLVYRRTLAEGDPCQSTTQYDYNGNLKKVTKGLEGITKITTHNHDGFNRLIETLDAMGNVSKYNYDAGGNLVSAQRYGELLDVEGSAGNVRLFESKYRYDNLSRFMDIDIIHFDPNTQSPIGDGNSVTQFFYSDNGLLTRTVDDNGNPTDYKYDSAGRLSTIIDAKYNIRIFQHDKNSNLIRLIEVDKSDVDDSNETFVTNFECDGLGRLIKRIDSVGNTTEYGYDSRGNRTSRVDALNNEIRYEYDGCNQLIRTVRDMDGDGADPNDPNDIVTQRAFDDSGRLISKTDDNSNTTIYEYDALNRNTRIVYADGTERTASYDVHHNPVLTMDGNGNIVTNTYDLLNRLTNKAITQGPDVAHTTTFENYQYDGCYRVTNVVDDGAIFYIRYDSLSNLVEETLNGQKTSSVYDGMGNRLSLTYPGGRKIDYVYDALNLPSILIDGSETKLTNKYVGRRIARADYGNGTRTIYQYDGMKERFNPPGDFGVKQIIKTMHVRIADGNQIDVRTYKWDKVGSKKQRKDIRLGGHQLTHDYVYDRIRRLVKTTVTDGAVTVARQTSYDPDGVGNRQVVMGSPDSGPWVGNYIMDPTLPEPGDFQMNQYTFTPSDSRQYSKNGNLKIIDDYTPPFDVIKYDYRNRMVEYMDGSMGQRHTYRYDALGRRITKVVDADGAADGPTETCYHYAGGRIIEKRDGTGATQASYLSFTEDTPYDIISMHRGGQDYYYHSDDIDSVMAVTNKSGNVVERYRYADYGIAKVFDGKGQPIATSAIGNPYMFKGLHNDQETGLYNLSPAGLPSCYLDPVVGRYTTRGPGGALGNLDIYPGRCASTCNTMQEMQMSIIGILIALNRPSSAGLTIGGWNDGGVFMPTQAGWVDVQVDDLTVPPVASYRFRLDPDDGPQLIGWILTTIPVASLGDIVVCKTILPARSNLDVSEDVGSNLSGMPVNAAALLQSAFPDYPYNLMPGVRGASFEGKLCDLSGDHPDLRHLYYEGEAEGISHPGFSDFPILYWGPIEVHPGKNDPPKPRGMGTEYFDYPCSDLPDPIRPKPEFTYIFVPPPKPVLRARGPTFETIPVPPPKPKLSRQIDISPFLNQYLGQQQRPF